MVNWRMFGEKMPKTEEEWLQEFENYQQYPEFKLLEFWPLLINIVVGFESDLSLYSSSYFMFSGIKS